jgi:hypothetical protein
MVSFYFIASQAKRVSPSHPVRPARSSLTTFDSPSSREDFLSSGTATFLQNPRAAITKNTGIGRISFPPQSRLAALLAHKSQNGEQIWKEHHDIMATFRGRELGVAAAEAFGTRRKARRRRKRQGSWQPDVASLCPDFFRRALGLEDLVKQFLYARSVARNAPNPFRSVSVAAASAILAPPQASFYLRDQ